SLDEADATAARSLALHERGRVLMEADALRIRAEIALSRGDSESSLARVGEALERLGSGGDRIMRALLLSRRGLVLGYVLGQNDEGRACAREALALLDGLKVPHVEAQIYV